MLHRATQPPTDTWARKKAKKPYIYNIIRHWVLLLCFVPDALGLVGNTGCTLHPELLGSIVDVLGDLQAVKTLSLSWLIVDDTAAHDKYGKGRVCYFAMLQHCSH